MVRGAGGMAMDASLWWGQVSSRASSRMTKRAVWRERQSRRLGEMKALVPTLVFSASEMEITEVFCIEE